MRLNADAVPAHLLERVCIAHIAPVERTDVHVKAVRALSKERPEQAVLTVLTVIARHQNHVPETLSFDRA